MADGFGFEYSGFEDLQETIKKITQQTSPDKVEPILKKGSDHLADAVRSNIGRGHPDFPEELTGNLKSGVTSKFLPRIGFGNPRSAIAAMDYKKAPHSYLVEFGHDLVRGGKKGSGGVVVGRVKPYPYFRPAIENNQDKVLQEVADDIGNLILGALGT